jgi:hypothetical protein
VSDSEFPVEQSGDGRRSAGDSPLLVHAVLALAVLAVILFVTDIYVSSEHIIYWSDYAGYQEITFNIASQFQESAFAGIKAIVLSRGSEYNGFFTLPLLPFALIWGTSRLNFELSLAIVFLLPFALVIGLVATKLIPHKPPFVFWTAATLVLILPTTWIPTLRGYPDTGAAVLVWIAVAIYLEDSERERLWHLFAIGALLAASMIFRRHFAYAATAFLGAMAVHSGLTGWIRSEPGRKVHELGRRAGRFAVTIGAGGLFIVVVDRPFVIRTLTTNYDALYAPYMNAPAVFLQWLSAEYGWLAWSFALGGIIVGQCYRTVRSSAATFLMLFAAISLAQWTLAVRQVGIHYTLHFTPFIILGLAVLGWSLWMEGSWWIRVTTLCLAAVYLALNVVEGFTSVDVHIPPIIRPVFAAREAPLERNDYSAVAHLVTYVRQVARHQEPIYVAASSPTLNPSLLINAERAVYGWDHARLTVLYTPQVDTRDSLPLQTLVEAQYVMVARPVQVHLTIQDQRVVQVVVDIFVHHRAIARDFRLLPRTFTLAPRVAVTIYQRVRPTSLRTALETLRLMERYLPTLPGGQGDWTVISQGQPSAVEKSGDGSYLVETDPALRVTSAPLRLLYLRPLPPRFRIAGAIHFSSSPCAAATVHLARVTSHIGFVTIGAVRLRPTGSSVFSWRRVGEQTDKLLLQVTSMTGLGRRRDCSFSVEGLHVEPQ